MDGGGGVANSKSAWSDTKSWFLYNLGKRPYSVQSTTSDCNCCRLNQEKHNNFVVSLFTGSTNHITNMLDPSVVTGSIRPAHTGLAAL